MKLRRNFYPPMKRPVQRTFHRRGAELRLKAAPLLVLVRGRTVRRKHVVAPDRHAAVKRPVENLTPVGHPFMTEPERRFAPTTVRQPRNTVRQELEQVSDRIGMRNKANAPNWCVILPAHW